MTDITSLPIIDENDDNNNNEFVSKILDDLNDNSQQQEYESMAPVDNMEQLAELNEEDYNFDDTKLEDYEDNDNFDQEMDEDNIYSNNYKLDGGSDDLMTKIKIPIIIAIISLLVNNIKVDEILLGISYFNSDGSINILGILLKALLVGGIFYVVNTYVLNN